MAKISPNRTVSVINVNMLFQQLKGQETLSSEIKSTQKELHLKKKIKSENKEKKKTDQRNMKQNKMRDQQP